MWNKLLALVNPFAVIARELTALRELYELELREREKPIIRVTEKPKKTDTEVFYDEEPEKPKSALAKLFHGGLDGTVEDQDETDESERE